MRETELDQGHLPLAMDLADLYKELVGVLDGELATYIEPLADADPNTFGLSVVTVDGHCYAAGDAAVPFTIQSVSKPFAFGLALDRLGVDAVLERVGVEPTGDAFNSITVDEASGRPFNPMVNAGAIVTTSLLGPTPVVRERAMLDGLGRFAGHPVTVDEVVFEAEWRTGDRNRAIAYLMRTFGMLRDDVDEAVETYFRQCSVVVDARTLATMGATLANGGVNPVTGIRALSAEHVSRVLSVMTICGMYDYAGEWLYRIGLPAKSGVSGGVIAVLPGVLALGLYSPPLDERGNSVRGIRACEHLAERFGLHLFDGRATGQVVRRCFDASAVRSKRRRRPDQDELLALAGTRVHVIEAQGIVHFGSAEELSRIVLQRAEGASHVVLDLTRVSSIDDGAVPLLEATLRVASERGASMLAVGGPASRWATLVPVFRTLDGALERCEEDLLRGAEAVIDLREAELVDHELLGGMRPDEIEAAARLMPVERFPAGARVFAQGDQGDAVYFVRSGRVSVVLDVGGHAERLTTIGAGGTFGEMAMLDGDIRSASVDVEEDATCWVLSLEVMAQLDEEVPGFSARLCRNLAVTLSRRLRQANEELRVLRA